jgi:hypothetical protein
MGFFSTLGKVLGKVVETTGEIGGLSFEIQMLEADIKALSSVLPDPHVAAMLARLDRIKKAATAIGR